jgi:hypothetical protein
MATNYRALRADLLADIDERIAVCDKATAGPWAVRTVDGEGYVVDSDGVGVAEIIERFADTHPDDDHNGRFAVSSRNSRPGELAALRAVVECADRLNQYPCTFDSAGLCVLIAAARALWHDDKKRLARHGLEVTP